MSTFVFEGYSFDSGTARFVYSFEGGLRFAEEVSFAIQQDVTYDEEVFSRALFLAFMLVGTSYYKTSPTRDVKILPSGLDSWQADFFSKVYQEGLSQFAFENDLNRGSLAQFQASPTAPVHSVISYKQRGILSLQSGGKDSLLTAKLLDDAGHSFTPWYLANSESHPAVLDGLGSDSLVIARRKIDHESLQNAKQAGGLNGHVPVTYIVQSLALLQAILLGKHKVLTSIGHEGEEPHANIDDLPVTHQWSKTWVAEQLFSHYIERYVSPDIIVGSPLRSFSELKIAELFVDRAWEKYGHSFSSCNIANYTQGAENSNLSWCGECPKCANAFLLFAPFVESSELVGIFGGRDLFVQPNLQDTFKGLLGIDDVMKPFECVGEIDELRLAYHLAQEKGGYGQLAFGVPSSSFDYNKRYPSQDIAI